MRKTLIYRILLGLYLIAMLVVCFANFSNIPDMGMNDAFLGIPADKWIHFIMFFPFPALSFLAFRNQAKETRQSIIKILIIFITGCFLAALTEFIQGLTSYRDADILDFCADTFGLALCSIIVFIATISKKCHSMA